MSTTISVKASELQHNDFIIGLGFVASHITTSYDRAVKGPTTDQIASDRTIWAGLAAYEQDKLATEAVKQSYENISENARRSVTVFGNTFERSFPQDEQVKVIRRQDKAV